MKGLIQAQMPSIFLPHRDTGNGPMPVDPARSHRKTATWTTLITTAAPPVYHSKMLDGRKSRHQTASSPRLRPGTARRKKTKGRKRWTLSTTACGNPPTCPLSAALIQAARAAVQASSATARRPVLRALPSDQTAIASQAAGSLRKTTSPCSFR